MTVSTLIVALAVPALFLLRRLTIKTESAPLGAPSLEEVKRLAEGGYAVEAIKMYREVTGASLAEAKTVIEGLARGAVPPPPTPPAREPQIDARIQALLHEDKVIDATRLFRETYGGDLKDAKDAIDRIKVGL